MAVHLPPNRIGGEETKIACRHFQWLLTIGRGDGQPMSDLFRFLKRRGVWWTENAMAPHAGVAVLTHCSQKRSVVVCVECGSNDVSHQRVVDSLPTTTEQSNARED